MIDKHGPKIPLKDKPGWWVVRWEDGRVGCAEGKYLTPISEQW